MSSILNALKKLEHEKSGRFPDSLKIDSDILKTAETPRSYSSFSLALLLLLVFGGGAAVACFFMKDTKASPTTTSPPAVVTAKSLPSRVPAPAVEPETLPAEIVVVPARTETSGNSSRQQQQKPAATGKATDSIIKKTTKAAVSGLSKQPKEANEALKREPPATVAVPTLRVNGIAFQNNSRDCMAIVNGTPVSSGSIIEGITVEEVRNDRVLFQRNGEKFEILLGQSNR